jgi:hypothetical protein
MGKKIYITENQLDYIIKNVDRLNEQVVETKTPTYNFGDLFEDNMVTPRRTPEYIAEGKKMLGDINKALSEGKDIKDIKIKIVSRASTDSATKCLPANINTPDHYYGKSKEEIQWKHCPTDADKVANVVEDVKPTEGNWFLAKTRGNNLLKILKEDMKKGGLDIPDTNYKVSFNVKGKGNANQFVNATVDGLFTKPEAEMERLGWWRFSLYNPMGNNITHTYWDVASGKEKTQPMKNGESKGGTPHNFNDVMPWLRELQSAQLLSSGVNVGEIAQPVREYLVKNIKLIPKPSEKDPKRLLQGNNLFNFLNAEGSPLKGNVTNQGKVNTHATKK